MNAFLLLEEVTETKLFACTTSKKAMKFNTRLDAILQLLQSLGEKLSLGQLVNKG